jgi:hypothetical protein
MAATICAGVLGAPVWLTLADGNTAARLACALVLLLALIPASMLAAIGLQQVWIHLSGRADVVVVVDPGKPGPVLRRLSVVGYGVGVGLGLLLGMLIFMPFG